jgi:2-polyprenyl-3-methyl-5-hydroxy-6-metoxy-1,4-benzoquinol methylase
VTGGTASAAPQLPPTGHGRQHLGWHYDTLAALLDATTFRHLDRLGVAAGQRCWEVGAGSITVPAWLARRTGPAGHVLATDTDVTFLQEAGDLSCEIARHDIGADPAPPGAFDLVHARLVLEHVPGRDAALRTMTRALRPGGWLLVESADPRLQPLACPDEAGPAQELANRLRSACWTLQARRTDLGYGRTLVRRLRSAGLTEIGAEASFPLVGPAAARLQRTLVERAREHLTATGMATTEEIDQHLADIDAGRLDLTAFPVISAWGRKEH